MSYAGFWRRFVAFVIDAILVGVVLTVLSWFVGGWDRRELEAFDLAWLILTWPYFAGFESSARQATLGKQALGLKVTDLDGRRITFARATGRHFGKFLSALILMIGFVMAAFTQRKQALHDMMAGTLVLKSW